MAWGLRGGGVTAALARVADLLCGGGVGAAWMRCWRSARMAWERCRDCTWGKGQVEGCTSWCTWFILVMRLFLCLLVRLALYLLSSYCYQCTCCGTCPGARYVLVEALVCVPVKQHFKHVNRPWAKWVAWTCEMLLNNAATGITGAWIWHVDENGHLNSANFRLKKRSAQVFNKRFSSQRLKR